MRHNSLTIHVLYILQLRRSHEDRRPSLRHFIDSQSKDEEERTIDARRAALFAAQVRPLFRPNELLVNISQVACDLSRRQNRNVVSNSVCYNKFPTMLLLRLQKLGA